jgi:hypothetical protein
MNLEKELTQSHSGTQTEILVEWIGARQSRFELLMHIVLGEDETLARRAARVMSECAGLHLQLPVPHLTSMMEVLSDRSRHGGIRRPIVRVFQTVPLPEELAGRIYEICFSLISDPDEMAAIQAFAMTTLSRVCETHPELAGEVALAIREHMPYRSAAFRARGKRTLAELAKISR